MANAISKKSEFRRTLRKLYEVCRARGLELPWLVTAVSINGSVVAIRVTAAFEETGVDARVITEHYVDDRLVFPVHFMVIDATVNAFHALLNASGVTVH